MTDSIDNITTAILRFRDLATFPGKTIDNHSEIAKEKGSVWWGWWNKSGETVPEDAFRKLRKMAKSDTGLRLILFDSGGLKIYSAVCKEIHWRPTLERTKSPKTLYTPDYYRDTEYLAWFSLSSFQEVEKNELNNFTYVRVDEFFEERQSKFSSFYGKQVNGVEELKQQERTIWFVRPYQEGDHTHRIELLDSARIAPADFPKDYITSRSLNLLWISDLHFGPAHRFPPTSDSVKYDLGQAIEKALGDHSVFDYAGLIVSGDITWRASTEEFKDARGFLQRLTSSPSSLENYSIVPSPGNHDLAFTATPEDKSARIHTAVTPQEARAAYADFYEGLFYKRPNEYISCGRRFLLGECIPVEVISLNSSLLDQKKDWFQGHGFIGDAQLRHAAKNMGWDSTKNKPKAFRILVLHHHLMPVTFRDTPTGGYPYSVVLDSEAVVQWIVEHRIDLVLHGHMHKSFIAQVRRPPNGNPDHHPWHAFHIAGLASTGVDKNHADGDNAFAVLAFSNHGVQLRWFTVDPKNKSKKSWELQIPFAGRQS